MSLKENNAWKEISKYTQLYQPFCINRKKAPSTTKEHPLLDTNTMQNASAETQILQQVLRAMLVLKEKRREGKMLEIMFHIPFSKKNRAIIPLLFSLYSIYSWRKKITKTETQFERFIFITVLYYYKTFQVVHLKDLGS